MRPVLPLFGACVLVVCMPAQIESARWWRSPRYTTALRLSETQSLAIDRIYREALPRQRARAKEAEATRAVLDQMIADDVADTVVERALVEAAQADGARWRGRTLMLCRVLRVLSTAQRAQLQAIVVEDRDDVAFEDSD